MDTVKWLGGGLLAVLVYLIVSNTLWLLLGSRLLQSLPGVDIKGFRGTIRIALMLVLTVFALACWAIKRPAKWIGALQLDRPLPVEVSHWVKIGARWVESLRSLGKP